MKHIRNSYVWKSIVLVVILIILDNVAVAQTDTTKPKPVDSVQAMSVDTTVAAQPAATTSSSTSSTKKRQFIIYAGPNSNQMGGSTDKYNSNSGVGYHIGVAWQKSGFLYGQFGVRYNNAIYGFQSKATSKDTGDLRVSAIDIPLSAGLNFLSIGNLASLRAFVSAMPSFTIGVNDNQFGIVKDDVNSFIFYGQVGIGANVAFAMIDLGYNYGFSDLMKNFENTNPGQWFLSLGVRF
jgi:hypothetical protein